MLLFYSVSLQQNAPRTRQRRGPFSPIQIDMFTPLNHDERSERGAAHPRPIARRRPRADPINNNEAAMQRARCDARFSGRARAETGSMHPRNWSKVIRTERALGRGLATVQFPVYAQLNWIPVATEPVQLSGGQRSKDNKVPISHDAGSANATINIIIETRSHRVSLCSTVDVPNPWEVNECGSNKVNARHNSRHCSRRHFFAGKELRSGNPVEWGNYWTRNDREGFNQFRIIWLPSLNGIPENIVIE
ncbi:unnamed protein product, partial [Iphiclides podalirius]